jgi:hypothetical protein
MRKNHQIILRNRYLVSVVTIFREIWHYAHDNISADLLTLYLFQRTLMTLHRQLWPIGNSLQKRRESAAWVLM